MTFADLHRAGSPLLLPNAWDVASALTFADAGFRAIGTTSMGLAAADGVPDGRRGSRIATERLVRALEPFGLLVSADLEDGYSDDAGEVAAFVASLPVAGLNIEDSAQDRLVAPSVLAAKIAAVKEGSSAVFVNARVDTYWLGQDATVEATLGRAAIYVAAGADGIFVPGVKDPEAIRRLCAEIPLPVNVLALPGTSLDALGSLGVRRVSTGSLPYRVALQAALDTVLGVREGATPPRSITYPALQERLLATDS